MIPSQTFIELPGHQPINLRPVGPDGRQGRNWALAPMLGEGASAWSLMAVAGADLTAADMAARRPDGQGDIILADTHYGRLAFGNKTTTNVFIGERGLTQLAIDELGLDQSLPVSYTHLDVYKRQGQRQPGRTRPALPPVLFRPADGQRGGFGLSLIHI